MIREYIIKISDEIMEDEISDRPPEIIRCKDCKWLVDGRCYNRKTMAGAWVDKNWFCAGGEKDDGD